MFPLANMLHLFPHKFARLRRWRLSFALVFPSAFNCFLFWHSKMVSLTEIGLVVTLCGTLIKPEIAAFLDVRWARGVLNTLPQRLRQYLLDQPETTDDLHVVSVILKDGRVFEDVAISHCSLVAAVRGHAHVPFDAKDIAELRVTHRRWGFGQEIKPS
jgi:hypothetical protein